ncbi:MAG: hypothetical protein KKG09_09765 [Verrucomicrobia bacterium]|nr:hypothetical protein [Verrucomicrobiota bacterium]MCG2680523.1 hypothetical protein [Kiritimatiellia bacterium]MBU4248246.1 hypothetical protein [Verrucomicrobiota bacterium]MBU4290449.1 hypothetical protein [Verrucomicrobiota bacterium]MBU4428587.1 hypothetical protein [Verrucomicrobiota bacterium]
MRRQLCWKERLADGAKREVRVTVLRRSLKWQFKLLTEEKWDYDRQPFPADWDNLLERMEARYQRRSAPYDYVELVRRLRNEALGRRGLPVSGS